VDFFGNKEADQNRHDDAAITPLADRLRRLPGVEQVVAMGNLYSVSGRDGALIEQGLARLPDLRFEHAETGLEQVFIQLMENVQDVAP